jgi:glycine dehydrogenase subunit 2
MAVTRPQQEEGSIFERSRPGRVAYSFQHEVEGTDTPVGLPSSWLREPIEGLPELWEGDVVRHFTRLSQWNYGVDTGFYPLGSCTMKYNPKVNEVAVRHPAFAGLHPRVPDQQAQGALQVMWELQEFLKAITGLDAVTLQPAAGAQGEFTALKVIRRCLAERGDPRAKVLIPDTAHGTNPASCTLNDYKVVPLKSGKDGILTPDEVERKMDAKTAGVMITNPNTLGKFEKNIVQIAEIVHSRGGFVYADGANLNSFMGWADVKRLGVDAIHINLHKTFSTPHGGGGPGAGPVAVVHELEPYLPVPRVVREGERLRLDWDQPRSVGKVMGNFGNFGVLLRAWTYIRELGPDGIRKVAEMAVLNANYLRTQVEGDWHVPYPGLCMHEFVACDKNLPNHVHTLNVAKRLIDLGFHPPTVYFPLIVSGALMVEPTETEGKETLDAFAAALKTIAREAAEAPDTVLHAPHHAVRTLLDEVKAARTPVLKWGAEAASETPSHEEA